MDKEKLTKTAKTAAKTTGGCLVAIILTAALIACAVVAVKYAVWLYHVL